MDLRSGNAIETVGLTKAFGPTRAVDGIDLTVPAGLVYGFLGPNGAGKTTTIRMLATLLRPDDGTARVFGHDVVREADSVRARIGLTGQFAAVDEDLTARENLVIIGRLLGHSTRSARSRTDDLIAVFDIDGAADRQVKTLSGGMRRRLDVAASLFVRPDLLFLDEPTTGLDPASRNRVWDVVRMLAAAGTTVLLTTQYLDEADQLAARIAVINHGRLIAEGTPADLKVSAGAGTLRVRLRSADQHAEAVQALARVLGVPIDPHGDPSQLVAHGADPQRAALAIAELARAEVAVADFMLGQPTLDEVFLALTGHPTTTEKELAA